MDSYPPLHKQLATKFVAVFVLFFISISMLFLAFYQRDNQLYALFEDEVPNTHQYIDFLKQAHENSLIVSDIIQSSSAEKLSEKHQTYMTGLERLKELNNFNRLQVSQIIKSMSQESEPISRLSANHERNTLLQQNAKLQLQLIINEIHLLLGVKQSELAKLYQQITKDKLTDKVTVSRARAHAKLLNTVTLLNQTLRTVEDLHVLFSRLDLHYALDEFNYLTEQFKEVFSHWQPIVEDDSQASETDKKLLSHLLSLHALLFEQQNTLAKWRGQIRIAQNYFTYIAEQQKDLEELVKQIAPPQLTVKYFPRLPEQISIYATYQNFQLVLLVISALLLLLLISLLRAIRSSVAKQGINISQVTELAVENKTIPDNLIYSEETKLLAYSFAALTHPKHSEIEYQKVAHTLNNLQLTLLQYADIAYFNFNDVRESGFEQVINVLHGGVEQKQKSGWRHYFTFSELQKIILAIKSSRLEKQTTSCNVKTKTGNKYQLVINAITDDISGLLISIRAQEDAENNLFEADLYHSQQLTDYQQSNQTHINELEQLIARSQLQNQNIVKEQDDVAIKARRQLNKLLFWCQQKKALTTNGVAAPLVSVKLIPLIEATAFNIANENKLRKNTVFLEFDPQLTQQAELNVELFTSLLTTTAQLCLSDLLNSHLQLTFRLLDQNPGQQQIGIQFSVLSKAMSQLPTLVESFSFVDQQNVENEFTQSSLLLEYLSHVMQSLHVENSGVTQTEFGFDLQITLPIVHPQANNIQIDKVDFSQQQFVLLHGDKNISESFVAKGIVAEIKQLNGQCENITATEHLQKLLSVKHLKQNPVSAVIVTAEQFKVNEPAITAITEQLPDPLTPKLMVLPNAFNQDLLRIGLYENSQLPWLLGKFAKKLSQLLTSDNMNNQLVTAEIFSRHRFALNQVEVLFAAQDIAVHQPLLTVLQWLGLQIQVTNQESIQQRLWQSGRYLILISEFNNPPFVEMNVGRNVKRAVFTLSDSQTLFDNDELNAPFDLWQTAKLPLVRDIDDIINCLSPWLKVVKKTTSPSKLSVVSEEQVKTAPSAISTIELDPTGKAADKAAAFDLIGYAKNQGSPELAVFMLDEYLADIASNMATLNSAITDQEIKAALHSSQNILLIASILVADSLSENISQLIQEITDKDFTQAKQRMKRLQILIDELTEYSEAI